MVEYSLGEVFSQDKIIKIQGWYQLLITNVQVKAIKKGAENPIGLVRGDEFSYGLVSLLLDDRNF